MAALVEVYGERVRAQFDSSIDVQAIRVFKLSDSHLGPLAESEPIGSIGDIGLDLGEPEHTLYVSSHRDFTHLVREYRHPQYPLPSYYPQIEQENIGNSPIEKLPKEHTIFDSHGDTVVTVTHLDPDDPRLTDDAIPYIIRPVRDEDLARVDRERADHKPLLTAEVVNKIHTALGGNLSIPTRETRHERTTWWKIINKGFALSLTSSRPRILENGMSIPTHETVAYQKVDVAKGSSGPRATSQRRFDISGLTEILFDEQDPHKVVFVEGGPDQRVEMTVTPTSFDFRYTEKNIDSAKKTNEGRRVSFRAETTNF